MADTGKADAAPQSKKKPWEHSTTAADLGTDGKRQHIVIDSDEDADENGVPPALPQSTTAADLLGSKRTAQPIASDSDEDDDAAAPPAVSQSTTAADFGLYKGRELVPEPPPIEAKNPKLARPAFLREKSSGFRRSQTTNLGSNSANDIFNTFELKFLKR